MENLVAGDLRIDCSQADSAVVLEWRGRSNDRNPAQTVNPYIRSVYDVAAAQKVRVEMRFDQLEHFNSSTITALIQMIQEARTRQLKLALVYKGSLKWQKLSFDALRVFAKDELLTLQPI